MGIKAGIERKVPSDHDGTEKAYHRLYYVRYADDYLIAVKGPKALAKDVKTRTEAFLKSNLHFALKGGDLIHGHHNKAEFLGFDIKIPGRDQRAVVESRRILSFKKIRNRLTTRKARLEARFDKAIDKALEDGRRNNLKRLLKGSKDKKKAQAAAELLG